MKYVLDTNIVTRLLKGDERVLSHLADVEPSDVGILLLVLAEFSLAEAVALVEHVRVCAARGAREGLEALAATTSLPIARIAIRVYPEASSDDLGADH